MIKGWTGPRADLSRNRAVISTAAAAAYCTPPVDHCSTDRQVNELRVLATGERPPPPPSPLPNYQSYVRGTELCRLCTNFINKSAAPDAQCFSPRLFNTLSDEPSQDYSFYRFLIGSRTNIHREMSRKLALCTLIVQNPKHQTLAPLPIWTFTDFLQKLFSTN